MNKISNAVSVNKIEERGYGELERLPIKVVITFVKYPDGYKTQFNDIKLIFCMSVNAN